MQRDFRRDRNYDPNKLREVSLLTKIFSKYNENKKVAIFQKFLFELFSNFKTEIWTSKNVQFSSSTQ